MIVEFFEQFVDSSILEDERQHVVSIDVGLREHNLEDPEGVDHQVQGFISVEEFLKVA